jgi:hypothetical protein
VILALDGTCLHESDRFQGQRFSVVAFLHKAVSALSREDRQYLVSLGFSLPPLLLPCLSHDPLGSLDRPSVSHNRTLIELCCSHDSMLGCPSPESWGVVWCASPNRMISHCRLPFLVFAT